MLMGQLCTFCGKNHLNPLHQNHIYSRHSLSVHNLQIFSPILFFFFSFYFLNAALVWFLKFLSPAHLLSIFLFTVYIFGLIYKILLPDLSSEKSYLFL